MDRRPHDDRLPVTEGDDDLDGANPTGTPPADRLPTASGVASRIGLSLPGALGAALLITALAFGANVLRPAIDPSAAGHQSALGDGGGGNGEGAPTGYGDKTEPRDGKQDGVQPPAEPGQEPVQEADSSAKPEPEPTDKPDATEPVKEPTPAPTAKPEPKPEPTAKATPKPTAKPTPAPAKTLEIMLAAGDGRVKIGWSAYGGDGFEYYKVVRSTDKTVSWPAGEGDALIGVVEDRATTVLKDTSGTAGKTYWYRVFAVRHGESGYVVLAASPATSITFPKSEPKATPKPTPEPTAMAIEVDATDAGIALTWEACASDGFKYYKVVRSAGSNPSYLPWTDGTELLAVVEDAGVVEFVDGSVESGDTWYYRVQSIGVVDGQKVVLGETAAVKVTVP